MATTKRAFVEGLTIDAAHSKDLDDAIWIRRHQSGWSLCVSVSDVASKIEKDSEVDREALNRAFTRYRARGNRPMLRRDLADKTLSLLPKQTRKCISVHIELDTALAVVSAEVSRSLLQSKRKMSHAQLDSLLDAQDPQAHQPWRDWFELAQGLLQKRREMGALAVFDVSKGLMTNEEGVVQRIPDGQYYRAYLIVQELMILANHVITATLLEDGVAVLFRNHTTRQAEVRESYLEKIAELLCEPDKELMERLDAELGHLMNRACYGVENEGHFGLNLDCYAHWTSPIRRYPDLVNHRILHAWLDKRDSPYSLEELAQIAAHVNEQAEELRLASKRSYARKAINRLDRAGASQLEKLESGDFAFFVESIANETLELSAPRASAISDRLACGALGVAEISRILFAQFSGGHWTELKKDMLRWLEQNHTEGSQVLHLAHSLCGWPDLDGLHWQRDSSGPSHSPTFVVQVALEHQGRRWQSAATQSSNQRSAEQSALFDLICKIVGFQIPQTSNSGESTVNANADVPMANPKGQLMELAQKHKFAPPEFSTSASGPAHSMNFSCVASISVRGQSFQSKPCTATSKKEAERLASADLLGKLPESLLPSSSQSSTSIEVPGVSNPVSILNEWAQKNHRPAPSFSFESKGDPHTPLFTCTCLMYFSDTPQSWTGVGTTKKSAKADAAQKACEEIPAP